MESEEEYSNEGLEDQNNLKHSKARTFVVFDIDN